MRVRLLVWTVAVVSSCSWAHAQNRLSNPDFDGNPGVLAPWFTDQPLLSVVDEDGHFGPACPNSDQVKGFTEYVDFLNAQFAAIAACLPVTPGETLHLSAEISVSRSAERAIGVEFDQDLDACENSPGSGPGEEFTSVGSGWTTVTGTVVVPDGYTWMLFGVAGRDQINQLDTFEFQVDRLYLGLGEPIFLDDFEGGETCRWSPVV